MPLTPEQEAIVHADFGEHCVITAVAGSGKTSTLAWRIRHLLTQGHDARRMLILMFNKQAQRDFVRKLRQVAGNEHREWPEVRTYHAMGYRLYQRFIREGLLEPVRLDPLKEHEIEWQIWQAISACAPQALHDEIKRNRKDHIEAGASFIDRCKTSLQPPADVFEALDYAPKYRYLLEMFAAFEAWRTQARRITFADMLHVPVKLIHDSTQARAIVENRMDFLLVDEYQDTNEIQHLLLRYVAGTRARVTVVGDPDQTIYEFRGARPEYILNRFAEEFESPREQTLSYSFRYGHRVALLANHLISHNRGRKDVLCLSHASTPDTRVYWHDEASEAQCLARIIEQHLQVGHPLTDIAVLLRVWSQSVAVELLLLEKGLPYHMDNNRSALASKEVEALVHVLELACGALAHRPVSTRLTVFERLLRFPHIGLGDAQLAPLCQFLAQANGNYGAILEAWSDPALLQIQKTRLARTARAWRQLEQAGPTVVNGRVASELLSQYCQQTELAAGLQTLAMTHEAAQEQLGRVEGFLRYLDVVSLPLPALLTHLSLLRQQALAPQAHASDQNGILISTIHRTKGLEWPVVIIPGLTERLLPYSLHPALTPSQLESERRLLYVAMTRAMRALHLIGPARSGVAGAEVAPSRFVAEMHLSLCDELASHLPPSTPEAVKLNSPPTPIARRYAQSMGLTLTAAPVPHDGVAQATPVWRHVQVEHAIFGKGRVTAESERSFTVVFEQNRAMEFSKQSAHLYFSAVPA